MPLHPDWKEFLGLWNSREVEYLIVVLMPSRSTGEFGFGSLGIMGQDFQPPGRVIQLGIEPYRIDLLTSLSGLDFDEAWSDHGSGEIDGVPVNFLSARALRKNKLATGRARDLADVEALLE